MGRAAAAAVLGRGNRAWAESCAQQKRIDLVWRCPERGTVRVVRVESEMAVLGG